MASVKRRGDGWQVRWRIRVGTTAGGKPIWQHTSRQAPTRKAADAIKRQVEAAKAQGREWVPPNERQIADLNGIYDDYLEHLVRLGRSDSTFRAMGIAMEALHTATGHRAGQVLPASELSRAVLLRIWDAETKRTSPTTATRRVRSIEGMWRWAYESDYRGVPAPRRVPDLPIATSRWAESPTWAEADAVIRWLVAWRGGWGPYARACWISRCQGLRMSSVVALRWAQVDLDELVIRIPPNHPGVKTKLAAQGWSTPIAPPLVGHLRTWAADPGETLVGNVGKAHTALGRKARQAWEELTESGVVRREVWDPPGRHQARPVHAFRSAWKSGLASAGVPHELRQAMIGGDRGVDGRAYVSESALPLREAIANVPALTPAVALELVSRRSRPQVGA